MLLFEQDNMYSISRSDGSFSSALFISWIHSIVIICYALNEF